MSTPFIASIDYRSYLFPDDRKAGALTDLLISAIPLTNLIINDDLRELKELCDRSIEVRVMKLRAANLRHVQTLLAKQSPAKR